jgi:hypothetical protein
LIKLGAACLLDKEYSNSETRSGMKDKKSRRRVMPNGLFRGPGGAGRVLPGNALEVFQKSIEPD